MTQAPECPPRIPFVLVLGLLPLGLLACTTSSDPSGRAAPRLEGDAVAGPLVLITSNGAWSWFQDERAIADTAAGRLVVGAVAHGKGIGGASRNGDVNVHSFDLQTGERRHATLRDGLLAPNDQGDDHMAPALWQRPDGRLLAMYAGHNNDFRSRYRRSRAPHDITAWGPEQPFDWDERIPGGSDMEVTYSNLLHLSAEDRLYNVARTDNRSPNIMVSEDGGETWAYGGKLTYTEQQVGYVNGYFKYATNGVDRIHFVATEHHPRDYSNGLYHGYVEDSASYASDGTLVDPNVFDEDAPPPDAFTEVFGAGTVVAGDTMTHAWTIDLHLGPQGRPYTVFQTRANGSTRDHRFFYARPAPGRPLPAGRACPPGACAGERRGTTYTTPPPAATTEGGGLANEAGPVPAGTAGAAAPRSGLLASRRAVGGVLGEGVLRHLRDPVRVEGADLRLQAPDRRVGADGVEGRDRHDAERFGLTVRHDVLQRRDHQTVEVLAVLVGVRVVANEPNGPLLLLERPGV
jgi:hypothetical protein